VGTIRVRIERGTFVGRCEGLGEEENESKGLWWMGQGRQGEMGIWELQLLRYVWSPLSSIHARLICLNRPIYSATDADALAVHRLLLYLPPAQPRPRPPSQQVPAYRNSLLLYDEHHQRIVSVLPLDDHTQCSRRPARGPLPPLPTSKPLPPPPRPLSPGAQLARYVDRVVEGIHPNPTPDALSAAERLEQAKIVREAAKEEKEWDPFQLGDILLAVPPTQLIAELSEQEAMEEGAMEKQGATGNSRSLESEPATLPSSSSTSVARSTRSKVAPSAWSVSSFATSGSERLVTADEFEDVLESSRSDSFATIVKGSEDSTFASTIREAQEEASQSGHGEEEDESTPIPTRIVSRSHPLDISQAPVDHSVPSQSPSPVLDPANTLTNGNAVLLSFLGASSIAPSSTHRIKVSAHPLSADQISEQVDSGTIEVAEIEIEHGEEEKGWLNWLTSLRRIGSEETAGDLARSTTRGWLGWLPWNWSEEASGSRWVFAFLLIDVSSPLNFSCSPQCRTYSPCSRSTITR